MRKIISTTILLGLILFQGLLSTASAQTDTTRAVSVTGNIDLVSRYVWRGQDLGKSPHVQPALSATWKDFTVGAWGTYSFNGAGGQETDFYISKSIGFVTVAVWDYWGFGDSTGFDFFNYRNATTSHLMEAQITLSGGETLPFNFLASYFFYGSDPSRSLYFELQYVPDIRIADLVVFAGYQAKGSFYAPKKAFVNLGCTVTKEIAITDRISIPLNLSLVVNPATQSAWLIAGITL